MALRPLHWPGLPLPDLALRFWCSGGPSCLISASGAAGLWGASWQHPTSSWDSILSAIPLLISSQERHFPSPSLSSSWAEADGVAGGVEGGLLGPLNLLQDWRGGVPFLGDLHTPSVWGFRGASPSADSPGGPLRGAHGEP